MWWTHSLSARPAANTAAATSAVPSLGHCTSGYQWHFSVYVKQTDFWMFWPCPLLWCLYLFAWGGEDSWIGIHGRRLCLCSSREEQREGISMLVQHAQASGNQGNQENLLHCYLYTPRYESSKECSRVPHAGRCFVSPQHWQGVAMMLPHRAATSQYHDFLETKVCP